MTSEEFDSDNSTEIVSVSDFIQKIEKRIESSKGGSAKLYFRGQEDSKWDIEPSIFRNDMLSIEHSLMQEPLQKIPFEFTNLNTKLDIMTKYQHYGMCTRLLDLTANPLVALYFACKICNKTPDDSNSNNNSYSEDNSKEPDGVVYCTNSFYSILPTSLEVKIIVELANYDLSKENKLSDVLGKLQNQGVINEKENSWLSINNYKNFVDIIQNNYVIVPPYTNERLIRQSGAFLLSGMFSITKISTIKDYFVTKTNGSLIAYFDKKYFVKGENKENILKELDLCNINESSLFPELEHQLNYIKKKYYKDIEPVGLFKKYTIVEEGDNNDNINTDDLNNYIVKNIETFLNGIVELKYTEDVKEIIKKQMLVDWYKREVIQSKMRINILQYLLKKTNDREYSDDVSKKIIDKLIEEVNKYNNR